MGVQLLFLHLHIVVFLLTDAYAPQVPPVRNSPTTESLDWPNYVVHLAFLQGFVPAKLHTLLDGSWSIVIEVYFYLLFAVGLNRCCRTASGSSWTYAASLVAAIAFVLLVGRHASGYSYYGFPAQLPCFVLGALVHRLSQTPGFETRFAPWRNVVIATSVLLMLGLGLVKGESKPLGDANVYALCFAAVLLASSALTETLPRAATATLASMGRQSYALFFVHLMLLKLAYLLLAANHVSMTFWPAFALNLVVAVPLSWLLAALVFHRIDRFFVALAARSLDRNRDKPFDWSHA